MRVQETEIFTRRLSVLEDRDYALVLSIIRDRPGLNPIPGLDLLYEIIWTGRRGIRLKIVYHWDPVSDLVTMIYIEPLDEPLTGQQAEQARRRLREYYS